jgi:hypothetical protein
MTRGLLTPIVSGSAGASISLSNRYIEPMEAESGQPLPERQSALVKGKGGALVGSLAIEEVSAQMLNFRLERRGEDSSSTLCSLL